MRHSEERTARKDHVCTLCHTTIRSGEEYIYNRITPWDHPDNDGFFSYKAHPNCDEQWDLCGEYNDYYFPDSYGMWMHCFIGTHRIRVNPPDPKQFDPSTDYQKMLMQHALQ